VSGAQGLPEPALDDDAGLNSAMPSDGRTSPREASAREARRPSRRDFLSTWPPPLLSVGVDAVFLMPDFFELRLLDDDDASSNTIAELLADGVDGEDVPSNCW
jgi:hypothetical protein